MLNLLVAYPYFKSAGFTDTIKQRIRDSKDIRFILDSGAFSAFNSGHEVDLNEYNTFLKENEDVYDWAIQLDVVGNSEETIKNLNIQLDKGLRVSPVFTRGMAYEYGREIQKHHELVFFGGVKMGTGGEINKYAPRYIKKLEVEGIDLKNKAHILGYTADSLIKTFKPFSCDSSSLSSIGRYGILGLYDGFGKVKNIDRKSTKINGMNYIRSLLIKNKVDPNLYEFIMKPSNFDYIQQKEFTLEKNSNLLFSLTCLAYVYKMIDVEKHIGTKLFLAINNIDTLNVVLGAYNYAKSMGLK